jgi:hypothetical protein
VDPNVETARWEYPAGTAGKSAAFTSMSPLSQTGLFLSDWRRLTRRPLTTSVCWNRGWVYAGFAVDKRLRTLKSVRDD